MSKILYFPNSQSVCTFKVFHARAAELLRDYPVDEETIRILYEFLRGDDAIHALKELRPYMGMTQARDTVIALSAWMGGRA